MGNQTEVNIDMKKKQELGTTFFIRCPNSFINNNLLRMGFLIFHFLHFLRQDGHCAVLCADVCAYAYRQLVSLRYGLSGEDGCAEGACE